MDARGALVINPKSGDPERRSGFVVEARSPADITVHGNFTKGFYVRLNETGVELGPYRETWEANAIAQRWSGILERAN